MFTTSRLCRLLLGLFCLTSGLVAQVPYLLHHQGRVAVSGVNFNGTGQFRFALTNATGDVNYWSNDGTAAGVPVKSISLPVAQGYFSLFLGDTGVAGMQALSPDVFKNSDVRLQVWFDDGTHGNQSLGTAQRIAAVAYAMVAASVPASGVSGNTLPAGITAAPGLTTAAGGVLGTAAYTSASSYDLAGAANAAQSYAIQRVNQTGVQSADTLTSGIINDTVHKTDPALNTGVSPYGANTWAGYQALANLTSGYNLLNYGSYNTVFGNGAGAALTTGNENTLIGYHAGAGLVGGSNGTSGAGGYNLTGSLNTMIGSGAGGNTTTGLSNVYIGQKAGISATTQGNNVAIGKSASASFLPQDCVIIGKTAGELAGTSGAGQYIVALGVNSGQFMNPGANNGNNVFIGYNSGAGTQSAQNVGTLNVYIGSDAGVSATTASQSVVIGALANATGSTSSVIIGYKAAQLAGNLGRMVVIGDEAGSHLTAGDRRSVFIGTYAGLNTTTGLANIFLGHEAGDTAPAAASNQFIAGAASAPIYDVYFGDGYSSTTPESYTLHGTGGNGTNVPGGDVAIAGGAGTGSASGGVINFQFAAAGASGSTLNSLNTVASVLPTGLDGVIGGTTPRAGSFTTLRLSSGVNAKAGVFKLASGQATVANTSVTSNSVIVMTLKTLSGTRAGNPDIVPTPGVGFTAKGAGTDNGTYNYIILEID